MSEGRDTTQQFGGKSPYTDGTPDFRPQMMPNMLWRDIGSSGLRQYTGWIREEFLRALQGREAARVFREMRDNNPTIGALMFAIHQTMRKIEWREEAQSDDSEHTKYTDFAHSLRFDMSDPWNDFVAEALSMLEFGFCLPPDQLVMRDNGEMMQAVEVRVGDHLMTKMGRSRPVSGIFTRLYDGTLTCINLRGYPFPIRLTPNHQVATINGWKLAGELVAGDIMVRPRYELKPGGDYQSGWLVGLYLAEGTRDLEGRTRITYHLHDNEVDEVAGILTEWIKSKDLQHERRVGRPGNLTPSIMRSVSGGHGGRVLFSHSVLFELIGEWVKGKDAWTKALVKLPTDEEFARGVIDGWQYGDGHTGVDRRFNSKIRQGTTVSRDLAHQLQMIAGSLGLPSPIFYQVGSGEGISGKPKPPMYTLSLLPQREMRWKRLPALEARVHELRDSGMAMQAIADECELSYLTVWRWLHSQGPKTQGLQCQVLSDAIGHEVISISEESYTGLVYDFEVEEDHTYCAGPVAIHNSPHEIVYKRRDGYRKPASYNSQGKPIGPGSSRPDFSDWNTQDKASSKYDDGLVGIRRLPLRAQETILRWYFDPNGQVTGMQQQPWMGPLIDIPVEKLLIFRPMHYKGNPEGRSILRNCYRPYFFSKRIEEEEAILFERMNGLPVLHVPSALLEQATLSSPAGLAAAQTLAEYKKIITNLRIDEQMGVILPSDTFEGPNGPTNVRRFELELLTPKAGGGHAIDSDKVLHRYSLDMLKTAMADFIDLGHQARGTQNLAISKVDMFFQAISGWLYSMADVLNRYMLVRVWQLNGWDEGTVPQYVPDLAQRIDLDSIGNFILRLSQAGARMFPDNDLENYLRDAAGMPDLDDDADYQPLQQLVNPASQVITQPGAQPTTAQPVTTPVPATTAGARGASGVKKPGGARVRGAPTGGAGAGGPFGKGNVTAGGAVADAILYEVAKAQRRARPPYRVQGDRGKLKRTVRAAA